MLYIQLENDILSFPPGGQVRGVAGWDFAQAPRDAKMALIWYTEGIGTQDIGVVDEYPLDTPAVHREAFVFDLPESPYSFSGTHITLKWAVELLLNKGKEASRTEIVVSPLGAEIKLPSVPDDYNTIKFFFGKKKEQAAEE